jgi:hypothetical protein
MNKSKLTIKCKPISGPSALNDLNNSSKQLSAIVAVHQERQRITKALDDHVAKTMNSYFSIDQLKKIIGG